MFRQIKEAMSIVMALGASMVGPFALGDSLPRPPASLPLVLHKANQEADLEFRVVEDRTYNIQIRFYAEHDAIRRLQEVDKVQFVISLALFQINDKNESIRLVTQDLELGRVRSHGSNDRSRVLGAIRLVPGRYHIHVKTLQDHPELEIFTGEILIPGSTFKNAALGKQSPSRNMLALLAYLERERLLDELQRLVNLPSGSRIDYDKMPDAERYFILRAPGSFESCGYTVVLNKANNQFWVRKDCADGRRADMGGLYTGMMQ